MLRKHHFGLERELLPVPGSRRTEWAVMGLGRRKKLANAVSEEGQGLIPEQAVSQGWVGSDSDRSWSSTAASKASATVNQQD